MSTWLPKNGARTSHLCWSTRIVADRDSPGRLLPSNTVRRDRRRSVPSIDVTRRLPVSSPNVTALIASGAPAYSVLLTTPLPVWRSTEPSSTYVAYAGIGCLGRPATARNVNVSPDRSDLMSLKTPSPDPATTAPPAPASLRKCLLVNSLIACSPFPISEASRGTGSDRAGPCAALPHPS